MKAVMGELREVSEIPLVSVLTGNGRWEQRILKAFGKRHDGREKILWIPRLPARPPVIPMPGSAFEALEAVETQVIVYGIEQFLFVVDREHVGEEFREQVMSKLEDTLSEAKIEQIGDTPDALRIEGSVGTRRVSIYAVVLGEREKLEENITRLLELEFGIEVEPTKKMVLKVLRERGVHNLGDLIKGARDENLAKAFTGLSSALDEIAEDP